MCKVGDIILVENYISNGRSISRHSFVVINDDGGQIEGVDYDIICNVMSSLKDENQRKKKLSYPGNFPITHNDSSVNGNTNDGYIKAEQFYFFNKDKINFKVIGSLDEEVFKVLLLFIENLDIPIEYIIDNL